MNKFQKLLWLFAALILIISCSKEKKIKRQLTGVWVVSKTITVTTINNGTPSTNEQTSQSTMEFKKDKTGTVSNSGQGSLNLPKNFSWSNTETQLFIVDTNSSDTYTFDIVSISKNDMEIKRSYQETIQGDIYNYEITLYASKG